MSGAYLFRPRGKGFAFQLAVPKDLLGRIKSDRTKKPLRKIIEGLKTDSESEAQVIAARRLAHWLTVFERARLKTTLTLGECEDAAREVYTAMLRRLAVEAMRPDNNEDSGPIEDAEWLRSYLSVRERALAGNDPTLALPDIEAIERRIGDTVDRTSPIFTVLAQAILRAQAAAIKGRLRALAGEPSERPATFLGSAGIDELTLQPIALTRPTLPRTATSLGPFALFERWIAAAKPAGSTVNRWRAVFLDLQGKFGDQRITEHDARGWANGLITEDRTAVTVHDIWLSSAKSVYGWAVENKLIDGNPFTAVKITVPRKVVTRDRAFTPAEARTILAAATAIEPKSAFTAAQRWCPWLAGYSGARMGEITQLRGADVKQIDGVWCLELSPEAGTIKSGTFRRVPLHDHLLEQGFLKFVEAHGGGPLFYVAGSSAKDEDISNPARPRAVKARERLAAWTRELGVTDKGIAPNHAWRHLWKTIAARAGISDSLSDSITGHASPTVAGRYLHPTVEDMAAALKRFPRYRIEG